MILVFSRCRPCLLLVYRRTGSIYSRGSRKGVTFDMNSSLLMDPCNYPPWRALTNSTEHKKVLPSCLLRITCIHAAQLQHKLTLRKKKKALDGLLWGNNCPLSHTHALDKECILILSIFHSVLRRHIKYSLTFDSEPRQSTCCSPSLCSNMLSQSSCELGRHWLFLSHSRASLQLPFSSHPSLFQMKLYKKMVSRPTLAQKAKKWKPLGAF